MNNGNNMKLACGTKLSGWLRYCEYQQILMNVLMGVGFHNTFSPVGRTLLQMVLMEILLMRLMRKHLG